ncbi:MAG: hypothetical protein IPH31_14985 [Lewinellaceae bacterium]|nr:hypothetical protein [Lewinellaceae bacterium]
MKWATRLYANSPLWLQNIAVSAYGYTWQRRRYGGIFKKTLQGFKNREDFTTEQFNEYQTLQLRRLLLHAFETVPYYQKAFKALGINGSDLQKFELRDLPRLPF